MKDIVKIIEWEPEWARGAPLPQIYSSESKTFLIYYTVDSTYPEEEIAVVEFLGVLAHKFGVVNDEALNGHPLYSNGLNFYRAHEIENSAWVDEIKTIHKVHSRFNEDHWKGQRHFILTFQDSILEIIAKEYKIETTRSSMKAAALEIIKKINEQN